MKAKPCLAWEQHPRHATGDGHPPLAAAQSGTCRHAGEPPRDAEFRVSLISIPFCCVLGSGCFPASPCPGNIGAAERQTAQLGMGGFPIALAFSGPTCNGLMLS